MRSIQTLGIPSVPGNGRVAAPGGHDQTVVGDLAPVVEDDDPGTGVEAGGPATKSEFQVECVVGVRGVMVDAFDVPLARQHLLGERRSVVGDPLLVAHDHDRSAVALVADLLCRAESGEGRSDDDDSSIRRHGYAHDRMVDPVGPGSAI